MHTYSQHLKQRAIKYFKEIYDEDISEEITELYLEQMAGLFESFNYTIDNDFVNKPVKE